MPDDTPFPPPLIAGNLDCDSEHEAGSRERRPLGGKLLDHLSRLATLLRVFAPVARPILWTPRPVPPACVPELPGIPMPLLASGDFTRLSSAAGAVLPWGETSLHARRPLAAPETRTDWIRQLWSIPPAAAGAPARVNHRGFALELAERIGCALPGAFRAGALGDLSESRLRDVCRHSAEDRWVAKAPWSSAGRDRVFGSGTELSVSVARRVDDLIERQGEVIVEPWMARTADFGASGIITPSGFQFLGLHTQEVTSAGQFRNVSVRVAGVPDSLDAEAESAIRQAAEAAADAMRGAGYLGAFGIDAWRYVDRQGAVKLHPLGEINARLTFGLVTRAYAARLADALAIDETSLVSLFLGSEGSVAPAMGSNACPLLLDENSRVQAMLWSAVQAKRSTAFP